MVSSPNAVVEHDIGCLAGRLPAASLERFICVQARCHCAVRSSIAQVAMTFLQPYALYRHLIVEIYFFSCLLSPAPGSPAASCRARKQPSSWPCSRRHPWHVPESMTAINRWTWCGVFQLGGRFWIGLAAGAGRSRLVLSHSWRTYSGLSWPARSDRCEHGIAADNLFSSAAFARRPAPQRLWSSSSARRVARAS